MATVLNTDKLRVEFFEAIYSKIEGYICIAYAPPDKRQFQEEFLKWPKEAPKIIDFIKAREHGHNMWVGAQLYDEPHRRKIHVNECSSLWADLDTCPPQSCTPVPRVVVESSEGRWQGYWTLNKKIPGALAEEYSKRIAYAHRDKGVDTSGWDLTQLLRIPYTYNYKYDSRPIVQLEINNNIEPIDPEVFEQLPVVPGTGSLTEYRDPPQRSLSGLTLLQENRHKLPEWIWTQHGRVPAPHDDWSTMLWAYMLGLFEHSFTAEEVYAIASEAACNKFARDGNPERLWPDVLRAEAYHKENSLVFEQIPQAPPPLLSNEIAPPRATFVERYIKWASAQNDAPVAYHEAGAFFILSALLSGGVSLESSIGVIELNLWMMILGSTTLTRKTTAMRQAVRMAEEIDDNVILATEEGSVEGILDSLQRRPKRPSVFYRDEIAGMLKGMARKDYLAGMLETFTKLYDGTSLKRMLRKDEIFVKDPIFIIFGGGIKKAVFQSLKDEHVSSGFLPRFLFFSGETDLDSIRPIGRKTTENKEEENALLVELREIYDRYRREIPVKIGNQTVLHAPHIMAEATDEAWDKFNEFQRAMMEYALKAPNSDHIMPTLDRMGTSMMKMATLIAASRQEPDITERITVELVDVEHALYYIERWLPYTMEIISGVGRSEYEQLLEDVYAYVKSHRGVVRSLVMRNFRLSAFEYKSLIETLVARGMVRIQKQGRGERLYPTDYRE
jgi:uncharacterized protein DUF3987